VKHPPETPGDETESQTPRIDFYSEGARIRMARLKRLADVGSEPEDESSYSEAGHIVIDRE